MKKRIWGILWAIAGIAVAVPGVLSARNTIHRMQSPARFTGIVAWVRHYGLRWEILLVSLGVFLLLTAIILFLMPRRRLVSVSAEQVARNEEAQSTEGAKPSSQLTLEPQIECFLRTHLMGTTFLNADGSSRQSLLVNISVGDVLVCRTLTNPFGTESIGVFTVRGRQLGYLDASFTRAIRERYPNRRIGVYVERLDGGQGVPYICDLRIAVYAD
ncbi:MAG: hypothetical protein IJA91_04285 [Clostridia bacterium]|nr:hypothetical protein [Clostridia bacterium]